MTIEKHQFVKFIKETNFVINSVPTSKVSRNTNIVLYKCVTFSGHAIKRSCFVLCWAGLCLPYKVYFDVILLFKILLHGLLKWEMMNLFSTLWINSFIHIQKPYDAFFLVDLIQDDVLLKQSTMVQNENTLYITLQNRYFIYPDYP